MGKLAELCKDLSIKSVRHCDLSFPRKLPMIVFGAAHQYIPFCPAPPPVKIPSKGVTSYDPAERLFFFRPRAAA